MKKLTEDMLTIIKNECEDNLLTTIIWAAGPEFEQLHDDHRDVFEALVILSTGIIQKIVESSKTYEEKKDKKYNQLLGQMKILTREMNELGLGPVADSIETAIEDLKYAKSNDYI